MSENVHIGIGQRYQLKDENILVTVYRKEEDKVFYRYDCGAERVRETRDFLHRFCEHKGVFA